MILQTQYNLLILLIEGKSKWKVDVVYLDEILKQDINFINTFWILQ